MNQEAPQNHTDAMQLTALNNAVQAGDVRQIEALIPHCPITSLNKTLCLAAAHGQAEIVQLLMPYGVSPQAYMDAIEHGHAQCLALLIPRFSSAMASSGLVWAATVGQIGCVRLLMEVGDPKFDDSKALRAAAQGGHTECVHVLIPVSHPKADNSLALRMAAENGHALIPVSNPKALHSEALQLAALNKDIHMMDILWNVSDPKKDLEMLKYRYFGEIDKWEILDARIEADTQGGLLRTMMAGKGTKTLGGRKMCAHAYCLNRMGCCVDAVNGL